ncbi:MAG: HlyD family efflux transporter periplasmic adaptor subunit [Cytophagales bacterium]|nr:HlyD family efflux transporter periplasmic adaptor subunit [Cytophagales bacterium]
MEIYRYLIISVALGFASCNKRDSDFDASGTFEADETVISSQATGTLLAFIVDEGHKLKQDQLVGYVDTIQLHLTRKQLEAQKITVLSKKPDIEAQLAALKEQLKAAEIEQARVVNLLKEDAATPKQLDDINAQVDITKGKIHALQTSLQDNTTTLDMEISPIEAQIEQIGDQIEKSKIQNPIDGTVLTVYAEPFEMVAIGQPLYKIADIRELTLRAYITGDQLPVVKLDQEVTVLTDDGEGGFTEITGQVYWISDQAEFTPKSIQTKDERANKVYAIKVRVKNDGTYKIGMYGEVKF